MLPADPKWLESDKHALRIVILAAGMRDGGGLSVGLNLTRAFKRAEPQNEYLCLAPAGAGYEGALGAPPRGRMLPYDAHGLLRRWLRDAFSLPRIVRDFRPDALITLAGRGLQHPGCVQVALTMDAHYYYSRRQFGRETWRRILTKCYQAWYFSRQLRHTQLVIVQTPLVERQLRARFGYLGRTAVCSSAVMPLLGAGRGRCAAPAAFEPLAGKWKLLYLTQYYPHKNLEAAISLFRKYPDDLRDVVLITTISPGQHPGAARFLRHVEHFGLQDHIINVGPIPPGEVAAYYENADALFMPTLLETFGIPYLEAMCCELPVLTSDLDFAHEVCGSAALYFDPWDARSMRDTILRLKADQELRCTLIAAGRQRERDDFPDWDCQARHILGLTRQLLPSFSA